MDKELISGAMDEHAKNVGIAFGKWLKHLDNGTTHYDPETEQITDSIGFSPFDCFTDGIKTVPELFDSFIKYQLQISNNNTLMP
jgi:hypothetical protein